MLVLALKNNGRLKKISISEFLPEVGESSNMVVINTDDLAENDYLECFVWDGSIFKPLVRKVYLKQLTE